MNEVALGIATRHEDVRIGYYSIDGVGYEPVI